VVLDFRCNVIEALLELGPGDVTLPFDPLLSRVTFDPDIRIFHKSLFDYLLDPSRSEALALNLGLAHETAANYILKHKNSTDNWGKSTISRRGNMFQHLPSFQIQTNFETLPTTANLQPSTAP
jgi:hypothetical protein